MEKIESTYNKYKEGYKINESTYNKKIEMESTYNKYKEGYKLNGEDRVNIQ